MNRPRLLLADDHTLVREAFRELLSREYDVVGAVPDGRALLNAAPRLDPDVVVLDVAMPGMDGLEAGRQLSRTMPEVALVYVTVSDDRDIERECRRIGASGYLLKSAAPSELFETIGRSVWGTGYRPQRVATPKPARAVAKPAQLTARQREVVRLLAKGHTMKEAAALLHVTPRTIAFHKYRVMEAHGLTSNAQLFRFAIQQGLAST